MVTFVMCILFQNTQKTKTGNGPEQFMFSDKKKKNVCKHVGNFIASKKLEEVN